MAYRKFYVATVFILLAGVCGLSQAQELKIGFVNVARVIETAPQGESALKKLEEEFGPRDREIRTLQQEVKDLDEDLLKNELVYDEATRNSKQRELRDKQLSLRRLSREFREDYNLRRNEELNALQKVVIKAVVEIAREESFDLILHEPVVFASDKIDITEDVLQTLRSGGSE